jgi:hypothetical protein
MPVNRDKPDRWKADTAASVDMFNTWFMECAPKAFRDTRIKAAADVESTLITTADFEGITPEILIESPGVLPTLRMACCPPLAIDRLIGLADASKNLVGRMEEGKLPTKMSSTELSRNLGQLIKIIDKMLDRDIFPWLVSQRRATTEERHRAATIVADRLCGAVANPIIRNAQEKRQLEKIEQFLLAKGYKKKALPPDTPITRMERGTFSFRMNILVGHEPRLVRIPVDAVVQPLTGPVDGLPVLIEAKSAGDYTNTNKRQKEEATKAHQLRERFGVDVMFILFLCGYFDAGYLGYEAAEGIDWAWEHRIEDLNEFGI